MSQISMRYKLLATTKNRWIITAMLWPPKYIIRPSSKAKRVTLRIIPHQGLEIVAPIKFNLKKIPTIIESKKAWIEKHLDKISNIEPPKLPGTLHLAAINETWKLDYIPTTTSKVVLTQRPASQLAISGPIDDYHVCNDAINDWLKNKGKQHLIPWLENLSQQTGLKYNNVTIRSQKSRWGSCSGTNNLSLNAKLLLLPPELVDHIIIHELCHTKHHHHGPKFWKFVAKFSPNYCTLRKKLRQYQL